MKWNRLRQLGAGVTIVGLLATMAHLISLKQQITAINENIDELHQRINVSNVVQRFAAQLQEEMVNLIAQLDRCRSILPVVNNESEILAEIHRRANENGIEIMAFTKCFLLEDENIIEHPFILKTRGTYHDYGFFFAQLTNYQRTINIKALQLFARPGGTEYTVEVWFVVSLFTHREPSHEELLHQIKDRKRHLKSKYRKKSGRS